MNLTTFHITDKTLGKFVAENTCSIEGQGLVNTYDTILFGNMHNTYEFELVDDNGEFHSFITKDKYIVEWRIKRHSENGKEYESLSFRAFGLMDQNREWGWIYSCDIDDYTHLERNGIKYFVNNMQITNKHPEIPLVRDIYNERHLWNKYISKNYECIKKITDFNQKKYLPNNLSTISLDKIKIGKHYYFVSENKIFPITIHNIEQKSDIYTDIAIDVNATVIIQKIKTKVMLHLEEISRDICYAAGDTEDNCYNISVDTDCKVIDDEMYFMLCENK
jgi:hypothetical protein